MDEQCPRCGQAVRGAGSICAKCGLIVVSRQHAVRPALANATNGCSPTCLRVADYALSTDLTLCTAVESVPVFPKLAQWLISHWTEPMKRAQLLGDGVRAGPGQLPSIYEPAERAAELLGVKCPEVFVKQDPTYNAYTLGTNDDHVVVIHSSLINDFEKDELAFIIGHEIGHIASRHVTYSTIGALIAQSTVPFLPVLLTPLSVALDAWSRESEMTADRAGYLATCDPNAALRALLLLAMGSRKLLPEIDTRLYVGQDDELQTFYGKVNRWLGGYSHPYMVTRVRRLVEFVLSEDGRRLAGAIGPRLGGSRRSTLPSNAISAGGQDARSSACPRKCPVCGTELKIESDVTCPVCGATVGR